jgi:hypothetical protein
MHPLLPTPENAMAAGMGGLLLAQRAPTFQQQQLQQRQLPPQLQQQRQQRLPPGAHGSAGAAAGFVLQQPQQLPAFWSGLIPSRGGLVPYPLQVCAESTPLGSTWCIAHFLLLCHGIEPTAQHCCVRSYLVSKDCCFERCNVAVKITPAFSPDTWCLQSRYFAAKRRCHRRQPSCVSSLTPTGS